MSIIMLLVYLALIGLLYWGLTTMIPMPAPIARVILVVCVVLAILIALQAFGLLPAGAPSLR